MEFSKQFKKEIGEYNLLIKDRYKTINKIEDEINNLLKIRIEDDDNGINIFNIKINKIIINQLKSVNFNFDKQRLDNGDLLKIVDGKLKRRTYHYRDFLEVNLFNRDYYLNKRDWGILNELSEGNQHIVKELQKYITKIRTLSEEVNKKYGELSNINFQINKEFKIKYLEFEKYKEDICYFEEEEIKRLRYNHILNYNSDKTKLFSDKYYNLCLEIVTKQKEIIINKINKIKNMEEIEEIKEIKNKINEILNNYNDYLILEELQGG